MGELEETLYRDVGLIHHGTPDILRTETGGYLILRSRVRFAAGAIKLVDPSMTAQP